MFKLLVFIRYLTVFFQQKGHPQHYIILDLNNRNIMQTLFLFLIQLEQQGRRNGCSVANLHVPMNNSNICQNASCLHKKTFICLKVREDSFQCHFGGRRKYARKESKFLRNKKEKKKGKEILSREKANRSCWLVRPSIIKSAWYCLCCLLNHNWLAANSS